VFFGGTDGDVQHVLGVAFEQFGVDLGDQIELAVLLLCVSVSDLDAADVRVPASSEDLASVVGQMEVLDEVSVLSVSLQQFTVIVRAFIGINNRQGFVS